MPEQLTFNVGPGFADPVLDSQRTFRLLLDAMARPGKVHEFERFPNAPGPLTPAAAAVCLTLLDLDTPLWLDTAASEPKVVDYLRFETGCSMTQAPEKAAFGLITDPEVMPALDSFAQGTPEYPDRSASLIIQVDELTQQGGKTLRGPGIKGSVQLNVKKLPESIWEKFKDNQLLFPMGVDLILVTRTKVACLPRTVLVED